MGTSLADILAQLIGLLTGRPAVDPAVTQTFDALSLEEDIALTAEDIKDFNLQAGASDEAVAERIRALLKDPKLIAAIAGALLLLLLLLISLLFIGGEDEPDDPLAQKSDIPRLIIPMPPLFRESIKESSFVEMDDLPDDDLLDDEKDLAFLEEGVEEDKADILSAKEQKKRFLTSLRQNYPTLHEPERPSKLNDDIFADIPSYINVPATQDEETVITKVHLKEAPMDGLYTETDLGPLPIRAQNGMVAWQTYARPADPPPEKMRIALILRSVGLNAKATEVAIDMLPPEVTLAFSPYAENLDEQVAAARDAGHEVLIELPMESTDFPHKDPGPLGLLSFLDAKENIKRLRRSMTQSSGYVGFLGVMGDRFANTRKAMRPILRELKKRGLLFINATTGTVPAKSRDIRLPQATADVTLDARPFKEAVNARLTYLEDIAFYKDYAVGTFTPSPLMYHQINTWVKSLNVTLPELQPDADGNIDPIKLKKSQIVLVPASAIVTE